MSSTSPTDLTGHVYRSEHWHGLFLGTVVGTVICELYKMQPHLTRLAGQSWYSPLTILQRYPCSDTCLVLCNCTGLAVVEIARTAEFYRYLECISSERPTVHLYISCGRHAPGLRPREQYPYVCPMEDFGDVTLFGVRSQWYPYVILTSRRSIARLPH